MTVLCSQCAHNNFSGRYCHAMGSNKLDARRECKGEFFLDVNLKGDVRIIARLADKLKSSEVVSISTAIRVAHMTLKESRK